MAAVGAQLDAKWDDLRARMERTRRVLEELQIERIRQTEDHGFDDEHDATQTIEAWGWLLGRRASDLAGHAFGAVDDDGARRLLVEIAAVSVAALEALDARRADPTG